MKTRDLIISLFAAFMIIVPMQASAEEVGGVTFARVGVANSTAALPFAIEVADYLNTTYELGLTVSTPIGGVVNTIIWRTEYESLAALEAFNQQLVADEAYAALVAKGQGLFVPGSLQDYIATRIY